MQNLNRDLPVPAEVRALVEQALGASLFDLVPAAGGFSNRTYTARIGEQRIVLKVADDAAKRADIQNEATVLGAFAFRGLPVSSLMTLVEDDVWTVEVLEYVDGRNGLTVLGDPDQTLRMYQALAGVLAQVHRMQALRIGALAPLASRMTMLEKRIPGLKLETHESEMLERAVRFASEQHAGALVHGDPGAHNVLWDGRLRALLDWEWAATGTPLIDIAWVGWVIRFRKLDDAVWRAFCAAYGEIAADPDTLFQLALAQIGALLARTTANPEMYAEWRKRLRWTLSAEFAPLRSDVPDNDLG